MVVKLQVLFDKFGLRKKMIIYINNKHVNLGAMTTTLKDVQSCGSLGLEEPFESTCFGHTMSKTY
jgi:hypothetical protein